MATNDPIKLFEEWFAEASQQKNIQEANAMSLATSTSDGFPSVRIVLLKQFDSRGFVFFTNLNSRKGKEIKQNPKAALCFYWESIGKQVRIEGGLEYTADHESDEYFASRRLNSRIGAWSSRQSEVMENENDLMERFNDNQQKFLNQEIPRPEFWGGVRLIPKKIEFWEAGEYRLHKRTLFTKVDDIWSRVTLYP